MLPRLSAATQGRSDSCRDLDRQVRNWTHHERYRNDGPLPLASVYTREFMKILALVLTLSVAGFATQQPAPISADEVTLRHKIYGDGRVTIFLLDIPPGQATVLHRHDRDMLSVFVNGGRTRASFNGAAPVEDSFTPGDVRFRSAGFTHSTENIGTDRFLCVIFEFVDSQGPRAAATRPATRICNPGSQTACVDEKPLFCTSKFCVDDLTMAPHAVRPAGGPRRIGSSLPYPTTHSAKTCQEPRPWSTRGRVGR